MPRGPGRYSEILDAFTRHLARDGYDGTNFGALATDIGVSKGTLVHHFGTKERMLAALHESYMARRLAELDLILERLPSPALRLAAILHAFLYYQEHDRAATVAFQREIVRLADEESMAEGRALRERYLGRVRSVLQEGIDRGEFRRVQADLDTLLIFGSAQWAWTWFVPDGPTGVAEAGSALVDLVLAGLLVDHADLAALAAADGRAAQTMRASVDDAAAHAQTS